MQLHLTVRGDGGQRDVVVLTEPGTTVAEVAVALSRPPLPGSPAHPVARAGSGASAPVDLLARAAARRGEATPDRAGPELLLAGQALDPTLTVETSGLLDGSSVSLQSRGERPEAATPRGAGCWEVHVLTGPDAGEVHLLPAGVSVLGRGALAEVTLADPGVDREHAMLELGPGSAYVTDLGGGVRLDDAPLAARTEVTGPVVLAVGGTRLRLQVATEPDAAVVPDGNGGLAYNRPPRIQPAEPVTRVTLPNEPGKREGARLRLIAIAAPLVFGVVLAVVLQQPRYLIFTVLSPVMVLGTYLSDRRHDRKTTRREQADYQAALTESRAEVDRAVSAERTAALAAAPGPPEVHLMAVGPRGRLWERRLDDADLLTLRVGLADLPAEVAVIDRSQPDGPPPLTLTDVPVVLPLADLGVIGIAGPPDAVAGTARWMVAQLAVLHSPRDVRLCVLHDDGRGAAPGWDWLRWLPHGRASEGPGAPQLVGSDEPSRSARVSELVALVTARTRALREARSGERLSLGERVVVVLDGARGLRGLTGMPQVLREGPAVGVYAVCLDAQERLLPEECRAVVLHTGPGRVRVGVTGGRVDEDVTPDLVSAGWATRTARALTPLRDTSRQRQDANLPASLRLLDELGLEPPTAERVRAGWGQGRSTYALLGRSVEGPFGVDLRSDGPHALVAGTTGAGKSELLQTLIASLAVANRPDALTFVLVDYKGGSAFKDCARLPHTVGMVTDLDGHLTERALASLTAELKRRETVLAGSGTKDVEDHWAARDAGLAGKDADPMPRLVIVIDEFASLVEELPEFVRGLVGIAQRGRSLGVHLVLATQRPGGVVSPEIRANTNLRIALRVTDPGESSDVIDAPDAATIARSTPGRGYVRTGHASLTAFQAARVGGRRPGAVARLGPQVFEVPYARLGHGLPVREAPPVDDDEQTDLAELVEAVRTAAETTPLAPVTRPWLNALPDRLTLAGLKTPAGLVLPFGLADRPDEQRQDAAVLDLERGGHLLLSGSPRSGRSTVLRTLAGALAAGVSTADAHLYGIDCGNGALLPLVALPHTGAIVTRDEPERLARLLDRLWTEVSRRQELLATSGFADLSEQRASGEPPLPYLLLMLDRWEGLVQAYGDTDNGRLVDAVLRLLREGSAVGLRLVVAADRTGLLGKLAAAVEDRAVLRLADRNDYGLVGMPARSVPEHLPPGRLFRGDDLVETQVALLTDDDAGPAQVAALQALARAATTRDQALPVERRPFPVDALPAAITMASARGLPTTASSRTPTTVLVGVGGDRLSRVELDVGEQGPAFVVAGAARTGRSTALLVMAGSVLDAGARVLVVLPRRSPLRALDGRDGVLGVLPTSTPAAELTALLTSPGAPVVLVVDDAELVGEAPVSEALAAHLRRARDGGGAVLLGGTTEDLNSAYRGVVADARRSRLGLLLAPAGPLDGEVLSVRLPRSTGGSYPVGRGLLVSGGELTAVQVPRPD